MYMTKRFSQIVYTIGGLQITQADENIVKMLEIHWLLHSFFGGGG